jgi:hypothetical protein
MSEMVESPATYVAAAVTLYAELPDTPLRASMSDQWLASISMHKRRVANL